MAPPCDPNFDPEYGPEQYVDEDDVSSRKGSFGLQFIRKGRTATGSTNTSRNSRISLRAIPKVIRRVTNGSQFTIEEDQKRPSDGRKLIEFLSRGQQRTDDFLDACDWYVNFIDSKCRAHWRAIQHIVKGVKQGTAAPDEDDIAKVDELLATLARALSETPNFALTTPVDEFINNGMIRDDDERAASFQLMFTFLGWLTNLYDPRLDCKPKKLQVSKFTMSTEGKQINLHSRTFDTQGQDLDEWIDQQFWVLLGRFGKPIPDLPFRKHSEFSPPSEWIGVPSVCYQTLRDVCGIEIEWVDAVGMHLEFDSTRKLLKLFRFPSFCKLMYKQGQNGLHFKLFNAQARNRHDGGRSGGGGGGGGGSGKDFLSDNFFREILLTYRLIFGQDPRSSKLIAKEKATLTRRHAKAKSSSSSSSAATAAAATGSAPPQLNVFDRADADPLLQRLCSLHALDPGASGLYAAIDAGAPQTFYTPDAFPFFAEKLLVLQAYVKEQHPHNWRTLWHDHRNKSNWWQFWAALFIGGGTLILGTLGLAFQIWQVVLNQQQLSLALGSAQPQLLSPARDI